MRTNLLALCLLCLIGLPGAAVAEAQKAILVLDASGSMWGQIDGKSKIEIAREVVGGLMQDWDPAIELGLTVYGHRSKGDCGDIEQMVPAGPGTAQNIVSVVNAVNPKGKTPLTASVRQAAEALRYTEEKATVILVSDGRETCNLDPCAISAELEKMGVDFTAHVVGFDVSKEERAGLECIAKNTGGRFLNASSAGELQSALAQTVQEVKQAPPPPPKPAGPVGLYVSAVQKAGGKPISDQVSYRVYEPDPDVTGKRKQIDSWGIHPNHTFKLSPGKYYVTAAYGKASSSAMLEVKAGELTKHEFVLGSGKLELSADYAAGGPPVEKQVSYTVYASEPGPDGQRAKIDNWGIHPSKTFVLPSGTYHVVASVGQATASADLTVEADSYLKHRFNMNAGNLDLHASLKAGGDPVKDQVSYTIYSGETDMQGNRRKLTNWGIHPSRLFTLPEGEYPIVAKWGTAVVEETIPVKAGAYQKHVFNLNGGVLDLSASSGGKPLGEQINYAIHEAEPGPDGNRRKVTSWGIHATRKFQLAAGSYLVTATLGKMQAQKMVQLKPGDYQKLTLELQ